MERHFSIFLNPKWFRSINRNAKTIKKQKIFKSQKLKIATFKKEKKKSVETAVDLC